MDFIDTHGNKIFDRDEVVFLSTQTPYSGLARIDGDVLRLSCGEDSIVVEDGGDLVSLSAWARQAERYKYTAPGENYVVETVEFSGETVVDDHDEVVVDADYEPLRSGGGLVQIEDEYHNGRALTSVYQVLDGYENGFVKCFCFSSQYRFFQVGRIVYVKPDSRCFAFSW